MCKSSMWMHPCTVHRTPYQATHPPRETLHHCFETAQPAKGGGERPSGTRAPRGRPLPWPPTSRPRGGTKKVAVGHGTDAAHYNCLEECMHDPAADKIAREFRVTLMFNTKGKRSKEVIHTHRRAHSMTRPTHGTTRARGGTCVT